LAYSRMSRFYVAPFFAAAFIGAWVVTRLASTESRRWIPRSRFAVSVVAIFLIAEIVPMRLGWPPSTVMVANQVVSTLDSPAMRVYAKGLFDRAAAAPEDTPEQSAAKYVPPRAVNDILRDFSRGARLPSALEAVQAAEREQHREKPVKRQTEEGVSLARRLVTMAANGFRKFFGPFPWVMPTSWDPQTIMRSDALLFPGMLLWYAVLPLGLGGGLFLVWQMFQRRSVSMPLLVAAGIVAVFLAQYLVLNLSWRQREFMFPFLLVLACFAVEQGWPKPLVRYGYAAYWTMLFLVAIAHLSVRAFYVR
jgi:cation transport ATPase